MSNETATPETPDEDNVIDLSAAEESIDHKATADVDAAPEEIPALSLEEQLAKAEAEAAELKDQLLRTMAEAQNVRKRAERQVSDAKAYAVESFARDLLDVSDNLARALQALPEDKRSALSEEGRGLLDGVEMTEKSLHAVLARHGVKAIDAAPGATFDPNVHQAVSQIPSDEPSGTVAMPFQTGWKIGERTLRAAMVAVSTGPAVKAPDS